MNPQALFETINQKNKEFIKEVELLASTKYQTYFDLLPIVYNDRPKVWGYMDTWLTQDGQKPAAVFAYYKDRPIRRDIEDFFYKEIFLKYFPGDLGRPLIRK